MDRERILEDLGQMYAKPEHENKILDANLMIDIADYIESELRKARCETAREIMTKVGEFSYDADKTCQEIIEQNKGVNMMCYQDRTFCPFYQECKSGKTCDRALNAKVILGATKWWGKDGAPISQFSEKPDCFKIKKIKTLSYKKVLPAIEEFRLRMLKEKK